MTILDPNTERWLRDSERQLLDRNMDELFGRGWKETIRKAENQRAWRLAVLVFLAIGVIIMAAASTWYLLPTQRLARVERIAREARLREDLSSSVLVTRISALNFVAANSERWLRSRLEQDASFADLLKSRLVSERPQERMAAILAWAKADPDEAWSPQVLKPLVAALSPNPVKRWEGQNRAASSIGGGEIHSFLTSADQAFKRRPGYNRIANAIVAAIDDPGAQSGALLLAKDVYVDPRALAALAFSTSRSDTVAVLSQHTDARVSLLASRILNSPGEALIAKRQTMLDQLVLDTALCLDRDGRWIHSEIDRAVKAFDLLWLVQAPVIDSLARQIQNPGSRFQVLVLAIKLGIGGSEPRLTEVLDSSGDKMMAEDFLNSGSGALAVAARQWAERRGYQILAGQGSHRVSWGVR